MPAATQSSNKKTTAKPKSASQTTRTRRPKPKYFIRNLRHTKIRTRLDPDFAIELEPRGQRGDTTTVKEEYLEHPIYMLNKNLLYEEISSDEAVHVINQQMHNIQAPQVHPSMEVIRDELGNPMQRRDINNQSMRGRVTAIVDEKGRWSRLPEQQIVGTIGSPRPNRAATEVEAALGEMGLSRGSVTAPRTAEEFSAQAPAV